MPRAARFFSFLLVLGFLSLPVQAQETEYGQTSFENSGADAAQEPFLRGLLMLHSFEYADARAAFQKAQRIDPDFVMAHWGETMTHNHPIWMEQDRTAGLEALRALAHTPEARLEKAATPREKAYLRTIHVLYGAGTDDPRSKEARDDAYAEAMGDLAKQYPRDLNAQAFHALSILGTAHEGREFETYMRAAAIVEEVFDKNPKHPGAAHYLIHAYDDPVHAPLGLRPARVYADIAPAATHALHMPSHIFFSLGRWERGAESNVESFRAASEKASAGNEALSGGGFHALHWLHYARLQQGRYEAARAVLDTTHRHATASNVSTGYATYMRWYMPLAYVVETGQWNRLAPLLEQMNVDPSSLDPRGAVSMHVGRGIAAAKQRDLSTAQSALEKARSAFDNADSKALRIQILELEGLLALKNDHSDRALQQLKKAAALEEERPLDYGPPFPVKPAHELYGEVLLALDRPEEALTAFNTTLERYPSRATALLGKARAAARANKPDVAEETRTRLSEQWSDADTAVRDRLSSLPPASSSSMSDSE